MNYDLDDFDTRDLIDGLYAWDNGCVDSGIKDDDRREGVKKYLRELSKNSELFTEKFSRFLRESVVSESRAEQGYGLDDLRELLEWFEHEMAI